MGTARDPRRRACVRATSTSDASLAQVVAYLASAAGDYVSGCTIDLGLAPVTG